MPTFTTPERVRLSLRLAHGTIILDAAQQGQTDVEVVPSSGRAEDIAAAARVTIDAREKDGIVEVSIEEPRLGRNRDGSVTIRLRCPAGVEVRAETGNAGIAATGVLGSFRVRTASGDLAAETVEGEVDVRTASGGVSVEHVGGVARIQTASGDVRLGSAGSDVRIRAVSGDIEVGESTGTTELTTVSGNVELAAVEEGEVQVRTVSGGVRVGIREGATVQVDARSTSGRLRSEVDLDDGGHGHAGLPAMVELKAASVSGDVSIIRAPASALA